MKMFSKENKHPAVSPTNGWTSQVER